MAHLASRLAASISAARVLEIPRLPPVERYVSHVIGNFTNVNLSICTQVIQVLRPMKKIIAQHQAPTIYDPNHLLNTLIEHLGLTNDGALSLKLKVAKDVIRHIRQKRLPIGASMLLWMHEASGISIEDLRVLMGDRRAKCRLSCAVSSRLSCG